MVKCRGGLQGAAEGAITNQNKCANLKFCSQNWQGTGLCSTASEREGPQKSVPEVMCDQQHQDFTQCQCLDGRQLFVPEMACTAARFMFVLEDKNLKSSTGKNLFYLRSDFGSKKSINWIYKYTLHSDSISLKYHCCDIYFLINYPAFTATSTGHNPSLLSELS